MWPVKFCHSRWNRKYLGLSCGKGFVVKRCKTTNLGLSWKYSEGFRAKIWEFKRFCLSKYLGLANGLGQNFARLMPRCREEVGLGGLLFVSIQKLSRAQGGKQIGLEFSLKYAGRLFHTIRLQYDTRSYFNVRSKADISQLNLRHGNKN